MVLPASLGAVFGNRIVGQIGRLDLDRPTAAAFTFHPLISNTAAAAITLARTLVAFITAIKHLRIIDRYLMSATPATPPRTPAPPADICRHRTKSAFCGRSSAKMPPLPSSSGISRRRREHHPLHSLSPSQTPNTVNPCYISIP